MVFHATCDGVTPELKTLEERSPIGCRFLPPRLSSRYLALRIGCRFLLPRLSSRYLALRGTGITSRSKRAASEGLDAEGHPAVAVIIPLVRGRSLTERLSALPALTVLKPRPGWKLTPAWMETEADLNGI